MKLGVAFLHHKCEAPFWYVFGMINEIESPIEFFAFLEI